MKRFREIDIKPRYFSGSDDIPLKFYEDTFPILDFEGSENIYLTRL